MEIKDMTDAELVEAVALERQVSELTKKNCELQEKLDEYENAYKFIKDDKCFNEEKHCACAPILRAKLKELEAENATLKARLEPIETAHRAYKNYLSSAIAKRDACDWAIRKCMEGKAPK
jgi:predicted nuclease with TOPRIM domain